jgi:ribonuclease VapC
MVIDTSAILACLLDEPERSVFNKLIGGEPINLISVFGVVEASVVLISRKREGGLAELRAFLDRADIQRVVVDEHQAGWAVEAFRLYGKGRHRAGLNIGDCFSYALAKATGETLLFKGDDFSHTDIVPAYRPA